MPNIPNSGYAFSFSGSWIAAALAGPPPRKSSCISSLDANGFQQVKLHAFDHFIEDKFDFVAEMLTDDELRNSIDIISGHTLSTKEPKRFPATPEVQAMAASMNKPIWDTEDHVYKKGFDCAISIVQALNDNYIHSGATRTVNWYDIAGVYPIEPYSVDPAMLPREIAMERPL